MHNLQNKNKFNAAKQRHNTVGYSLYSNNLDPRIHNSSNSLWIICNYNNIHIKAITMLSPLQTREDLVRQIKIKKLCIMFSVKRPNIFLRGEE